MTDREAMKLALEALEPFTTPNWAGSGVDKCNEAITAIKEALAQPEQEPVQEIVPEGVITAIRNEGLTLVKDLRGYRLMRLGKVEAQATPPQRTEPTCPECKAEVLYECVACSSNNYPPPQRTEPVIDKSAAKRIATVLGWTPPRTWVGLTDEEFWELDKEDLSLRQFVQAIEAKLKEKNT
jgi:hypothetical protein